MLCVGMGVYAEVCVCVYVCVKAAFVQLDIDKDGLVQGRVVSVYVFVRAYDCAEAALTQLDTDIDEWSKYILGLGCGC